MIIDSFCHFSFLETLDLLETHGGKKPHVFRKLFENVPTLIDVNARLDLMDSQKIDKSILVPLPWLETTPEVHRDTEKCNIVAKKTNDLLSNLIKNYPRRFYGVALLPTTTGEIMANELERAIKELNFIGGFMVVGPTVKPPDHPDYETFYKKAVELNAPIWIHPSSPPHHPDYMGETNSKYQIWQTLSWLHDTSTAMVRIVFSGIFLRYPSLKLIIHHHGALIPLFSQRMQLGWDFFENTLKNKQPTPIEEPYINHFKKFYCDTATQGYEPKILELTHSFFGNEKLLFGSDAPMDDSFGQKFTQLAKNSVYDMSISKKEKENIFSNNIRRLIPQITSND